MYVSVFVCNGYNNVFIYGCGQKNNWRQQQNAPHLLAVSMAMRMQQCDAGNISPDGAHPELH